MLKEKPQYKMFIYFYYLLLSIFLLQVYDWSFAWFYLRSVLYVSISYMAF